jgi:hypothetical protein
MRLCHGGSARYGFCGFAAAQRVAVRKNPLVSMDFEGADEVMTKR